MVTYRQTCRMIFNLILHLHQSPPVRTPQQPRVDPPPSAPRGRNASKARSVPKSKAKRPAPRPSKAAPRIASNSPPPTRATHGGSQPPAQPAITKKHKSHKRAVSTAPQRLHVATPPPFETNKLWVLKDSKEQLISTTTIRKWNWQLKKDFMQSGLAATDIIPEEDIQWYKFGNGQRHFG